MPTPKDAAAVDWLVWLEWALVPIGMVVWLLALPHDLAGDDNTRFRMLSSLLGLGHPVGTLYSYVGPMFAAPLWFLGSALATPQAGVLLYDWLLFSGVLVALFYLLRRRWEAAALRHFLLLLVAGSMMPRHLLHFGAEAFTAVAVAGGLALVTTSREWIGWAVALLGIVNAPAALAGFGCSALAQAWERRRLRYTLLPLLGLTLILLETALRTGSPFHTGYENTAGQRSVMPYSGLPGFSYPLFFGLISILFSFGRGLVFFASGLMLLPWLGRLRIPPAVGKLLLLWLAFLVGLMLFYAKWWAWYGGVSAGPRFFAFASFPASLLLGQRLARPTAHWAVSLGVLALLGLSCWTAVATTVFENGGVDACSANGYALEHLCWYVPEFSVLWNPFVASFRGISQGQSVVLAYDALAFASLSIPVVRQLLGQMVAEVRRSRPAFGWRW